MLRTVLRILFALGALSLGACSSNDGGDVGGGGSGVPWKITYTGALAGEMSGGVTSLVRVANFSSIACGGAEHSGLSSPITVNLSQNTPGEFLAVITFTMEDGTSCSGTVSGDGLDIQDHEEKTFRATFEGTMNCTVEDEKLEITFELSIDRAA